MDTSFDSNIFSKSKFKKVDILLLNIKKALIRGSRYQPAEIRELTKECISKLDYLSANIQLSDEPLANMIFNNLNNIYCHLFDEEKKRSKGEVNESKDGQYYHIIHLLEEVLDKCIENLYSKNQAYNSIEYYNDQIQIFQKEKRVLSEQIKRLKEKQEQAEASIEQKAELELELNEKSNTLLEYAAKIRQYEIERKKQEEDNDKIKAWSGKIKMAFETLKSYIEPIKNEHSRLNFLYKCYLFLSGLFILGLISFEIIICCKISTCEALPTWNTYFFLIFPMPIALGLLWGFIYQMNRAQRQMVILAKQIHEVEYVEGLLLTTNTLSTDVNESMNRINTAVNQLLENHLSYTCEPLKDELFLKKEESKDSMPYEMVVKLLKDVASVSLNKS